MLVRVCVCMYVFPSCKGSVSIAQTAEGNCRSAGLSLQYLTCLASVSHTAERSPLPCVFCCKIHLHLLCTLGAQCMRCVHAGQHEVLEQQCPA